jgi:hypothetical protein
MLFSKTRVSRQQRSTRLRVEMLEDRVTPNATAVTAAGYLMSPAIDPPANTSSAPVQVVNDMVETPVVQESAMLGWNTPVTGVTITSEALDTSNPADPLLVAVGYANDPVSSDIDLAVTQVHTSDGSLFNARLYNLSGFDVKGLSVAVDGSGTIYPAGTINATGAVARFQRSLPSSPDWVVTAGLNLKGVTLDTAGTNLYAAGAAVGDHATDIFVLKLTDLANSTPTTVYSDIRSSAAGASYANAIAVNSDGRADVAASVEFDPNTYFSPDFNQIEPDGTNKPGWGHPNIQGDMTGVALFSNGDQIMVGTFFDPADPTSTTGIATERINSLVNGDPVGDFIWQNFYYWQINGANVNSSARGVAVDGADNFIYAGSIDNGAPTGIDMWVVKTDGATGMTQIDQIAVDNGNNTDIANAIVLDASGNAYIGGTTNADGLLVQITNFN